MMRKWCTAFRKVFQRELTIIVRDRDILTILLISPLFYAFFYGSVYLHKTESAIPIAVVDNDQSALSRSLTRSLDAHQLLLVQGSYPEINAAKNALENWQVQAIVYLPKNFQDNIKNRKGSSFNVFLNGSKFLIANDINKAVNEVSATFGAGVKWRYLKSDGLHPNQALKLVEPLQGEIRPLFNVTESYGDFLLPGLLVLILQQTLLIGLAESMARETETGEIGSWLTTADNTISTAIFGKLGFYLLLYSAYALLFFTLHFYLFKLPFVGSILLAVGLTLLFLAVISLTAIFVGSFFNSKLDALLILVFTSYPLFLFSGYSWPLGAMPRLLHGIALLLPGTPYFLAIDRIIMMGANWQHVAPEIIHLIVLLALWSALAVLRFRKIKPAIAAA
jgi:ABC-2 type transport system permease protein